MLVACMVLALGVTVSAANEPTVYLQLEENPAVAGQFFVYIAVKDNIAVVDTDGDGEIGDAEKAGLYAYQLIIDYNKDKFNLVNIIKEGVYEGAITPNKNTATSVWSVAGGLYKSVLNETTYVNDITGITDAKIVKYIFNVKNNAITEADYGVAYDFAFAAASNATLTSAAGNSPCTVDFEPVKYTIPDTREPIAGLVATAKAVEYTGAVIDPASTIEVNTIDGDVVEYKADKEIKDAGTYNVTATVKRAGCKATEVSTEVVVAPKAITATVANATKVYGEADPTFTATAEGLVGEDTLAYTFTRAEGEDAGKYAINATATNANYAVTVVPGELEITKKAINVTMADKAMTYGDALPEFTHDAPAGVTITPTVAEKPNAGTVDITATAESANYDVTVVPGTLTVAKKAVTITAQNEFQVQGRGEIAEYKAAKVEGLVEGDEITNIVVGFKGTYADAEGVYATEVKSYDENANYEVTTVDGVYEIKTALPVVVTFGENKKTYCDADGEIVVSGDLDLVTIVRKEAEAAGTYTDAYEVTLKAAEDASGLPYALTVENNVFVIEPKAATITVADAAKKVEDADPAFTFTAEGFLEGEAPAEVVFSRAAGETAGEYAITATYADPNYAITVVDGKLTISKYALTVKAKDVVAYVGKEVPALEADITGAAEGDTIAPAFTVKNELGEVIAIDAIDTSVEAVYTIEVASDANADKYDVTYENATLTVRKASGRPSGGGTVVKPAPGGSTGGSSKPPVSTEASAKIALKEKASSIKFIDGFEDKTFRPDTNATRNDVVAALAALFDVTDVKNAPAFTDTDDKTVKALAAAGVINGYEDGSFKGHNDVTRAEFVKLLAAALKLEAVKDAEANFSDINDHWAAEWIKTFVSKGYIVGYPDGTFRPEAKITRAEMVVVITRVAGTVDAENAVNFADVTEDHWAYDYIMKAAK